MIHKYWLGDKAKVVISQLSQYDTQWRTYQGNPFYDMWFRNSYAYYSNILDADSVISGINFRGEKGELVEMKVPQARALIREKLSLLTKQRLAFQAIATLDDENSYQNMRKANAIVDNETKDGRLSKTRSLVAEHCMVLGTGYFTCLHRFDRGRVIGQNDVGGLIHEGEPEIGACHPVDMLYDFRVAPFEDVSWCRITTKRNRYDLIALYPDMSDKIMALPSCWERSAQIDQFFSADDRDMVYVYELIHRPSPALRYGRYISYSDDATVYFDDDNFYEGIPVEPVIAEPVFTYGIGYPLLSSLLPSQEMYDHEFSVVATNHSALAIRNISVARNSNISIKAMPGGLNLIQFSPQNVPGGGEPKVLDFNTPNTDVYTFQDKLLNNMQQMSSLNSAIRGDVGANTAGVTIATLTSNALEFMTPYSEAVQISLENIVYWKIKTLSKMVKEPRELTMVTEDGISYGDKYTGDDLKGIKGIRLSLINPMMQTMNGRADIGEKMLNFGLVKSPQEYISILDGAPVQKLWNNELSENDLILHEKEQLLRGEKPIVQADDNHAMHIRHHKSLKNNPAVRSNPQIMQGINDHELEHLQLAKETDPMLQAMANTGTMPEGGPSPPPPPEPPGPPPPDDMGGGAPGSFQLAQTGTPAAPVAKPAHDLLGR